MSVEEYRRHAQACLSKAERAESDRLRSLHLDMARAWFTLAEKTESAAKAEQDARERVRYSGDKPAGR